MNLWHLSGLPMNLNHAWLKRLMGNCLVKTCLRIISSVFGVDQNFPFVRDFAGVHVSERTG